MLLLAGSLHAQFDHSHAAWDSLLQEYVKEGWVDYSGLLQDRARLDAYLRTMAEVSQAEYDTWSDEQIIAFWVNAYNAFAVQLVLDHYPIKASFLKRFVFPSNSIWHIDNVWEGPKQTFVGRQLSLDGIEKGILLTEYDEPRIHFVVNCASVGCPHLLDEAYTAEKLEAQMTQQTRFFLKSETHGLRMEPARNRLYLSSLFDWYIGDYRPSPDYGPVPQVATKGANEPVIAFIAQFIEDEATRRQLIERDWSVRYLDYDWHLNDANDR